jgi:hypothetical protein
MRIALAGIAALLLAVVAAPGPAAAQGLPPGSYLSSCTNVGVRGNVLVANCRRLAGGELRTTLTGYPRCVGDIGNNDGVLQCVFPGGGLARGQLVVEPGYRPPPVVVPVPVPGFPAERCRGLHVRGEELRERRDRAFDPVQRARFEERLREVYMDQWRIGCPYR